jgi:thiamine pyrophosphokinase
LRDQRPAADPLNLIRVMPAKGERMARVAVVLAGGDPVEPHLRERLPDDVYVVAADSGVHAAEVLGLRVDVVVGDFDSADPAAVDRAIANGAVKIEYPVAKDATDLELALDIALEEQVDRIVVVGGAGGRLDHYLANVALLASPRFAGVALDAYFADAHVTVARGGEAPVEVRGEPGETLTLLPVGGDAHGVVTNGLEYPLHAEDLGVGTTRGVSNVVVDVPASVALESGTLLIIRPEGGRP